MLFKRMLLVNFDSSARWLWSFLAPHMVRGMMWILAGKLGVEAKAASTTSEQITSAIGALLLLIASALWSNYQQKKLLNTPAPETPPAQ